MKNDFTVCAYCGDPTDNGHPLCPACADQEELPPAIGARLVDSLHRATHEFQQLQEHHP